MFLKVFLVPTVVYRWDDTYGTFPMGIFLNSLNRPGTFRAGICLYSLTNLSSI
jgi:hypothetical protein